MRAPPTFLGSKPIWRWRMTRRGRRRASSSAGGFMVLDDSAGFLATLNFAFLLSFPSLFAIINPIGAAFIFDGVAKDFTTAERKKAGLFSSTLMWAFRARD